LDEVTAKELEAGEKAKAAAVGALGDEPKPDAVALAEAAAAAATAARCLALAPVAALWGAWTHATVPPSGDAPKVLQTALWVLGATREALGEPEARDPRKAAWPALQAALGAPGAFATRLAAFDPAAPYVPSFAGAAPEAVKAALEGVDKAALAATNVGLTFVLDWTLATAAALEAAAAKRAREAAEAAEAAEAKKAADAAAAAAAAAGGDGDGGAADADADAE
jgi:hypothetical protein